ncbi:MAG: hypothetical protein RMJ85_13760 [Anaerolineales bacterium]|nr:hypothetical protein [Anaerolineales bacterium]
MNWFLRRFHGVLQQESLAERLGRMQRAALYAVLAATAFVWSNAVVNVVSFPQLPLALDWLNVLGAWLGWSAALGLLGLIAGWFVEEYQGIVGGGVIFTLLLAGAFFFQMDNASTAQSVLMALPLLGVGMLAAGGLRWAARRHQAIVQSEGAFSPRMVRHVAVIVLAGAFVGVLGRMDLPAERALSNLHAYLQAAPHEAAVRTKLPVRQVPSLPEHFGQDYRFYVRRSGFAVASLDVTIRFADGFVLVCVVPVGNTNFFTDCWEAK